MLLGEEAEGALGAETSEQDMIADEMTEDLRQPDSKFYTSLDSNAVPYSCVDGRCPDCRIKLSPNAAGGTLSLWVAARIVGLTNDDWPSFLAKLSADKIPIGDHTDQHANKEKSGCGADDKILEILDFLSQNYDTVADVMRLIDQDFDYEDIRQMANQAADLSAKYRNDSPAKRLNAIRKAGGEVDTLVGDHGELVAVINKVKGTTLDRFALAEELGTNMAFNVDYWSFSNAAEKTLDALGQPITDEIVAKFSTAMALYNIATTFVLGGPNLRVAVRE